MATVTVNDPGSSTLGTNLQNLLVCDQIQPGSAPSYQICKEILQFHPLGLKMAEAPIRMAQSQKREISVPGAPDKVAEQFQKEWRKIQADKIILNLMRTSRAYGIASIAMLADGKPTNEPLDPKEMYRLKLSFNVFDPLNTSGSLVQSQDPNALDFQKHGDLVVQGTVYHRSRTVTILNEEPIYIAYTNSAFGYVGRSVYQRALFPLKSFVQSMVTDDMVTRKAGLLIAKLKQAGSIVSSTMKRMAGLKRILLKEAETNNVLSIDEAETIESLDLTNLHDAATMARKDILENIAVAADMPAKLLNAETFAEGFGEGTEDAKNVARYVDRMREEMDPAYGFFDNIVQYRAWNPEFYKTIQALYPDQYGEKSFNEAFYEWQDAFTAIWPNLLTEPDSEKVKTDDVKLKGIIAFVEVFLPACDPENKATLLMWAADNANENKRMFQSPLVLNWEAMATYVPPMPGMQDGDDAGETKEPPPPKPFADAVTGPAMLRLAR